MVIMKCILLVARLCRIQRIEPTLGILHRASRLFGKLRKLILNQMDVITVQDLAILVRQLKIRVKLTTKSNPSNEKVYFYSKAFEIFVIT